MSYTPPFWLIMAIVTGCMLVVAGLDSPYY